MKKSSHHNPKPFTTQTVNIDNKTTVFNFEKIAYDPISRKSNITKVAKQLNNFVQQNFKTLSNCISSLNLPQILPPIAPQLNDPFAGQNPMAAFMQFFQSQVASSANSMSTHPSSTSEPPPSKATSKTSKVATRSQSQKNSEDSSPPDIDTDDEVEHPAIPVSSSSSLSASASQYNPPLTTSSFIVTGPSFPLHFSEI